MTHPNTGAICAYCSDTRSELRRRKIANGSIQYVEQCLGCGRTRCSPVKASLIRKPETLPDWDDELAGEFDKYSTFESQQQREREHSAWLAEHDVYLRTPAWRTRRQAVLTRARGKCEGCGINDATQVHHLSYDHWKEEFLWELVAICNVCHDRVHPDKH